MSNERRDELISEAINSITEKVSNIMLKDFMLLPSELQVSIVLVKAAQLLLANVLCNVSTSRQELESVISEQGDDIKELTLDCAASAFTDKFVISVH